MTPIPVELHEQYNNIFDYVSLEAMLTILIGGLATLGGAYLGAKKAGEKSVEAVTTQINHFEKEKQEELFKKREKYNAFLNIHLSVIKNESFKIAFYVGLYLSPSQPYNIDPITELKESLQIIKEKNGLLYSMDPSYISLENFVLLKTISNITYEMENRLNSFYATEEEEAEYNIECVRGEAKDLIDKLNEVFN